MRPYIDDYDQLSRIYRLLRSAYDSVFVDKELTRKTARLVQEYTKGSVIKDTLDVYEINESLLERLAQNDTADTVKVFNLLKSIEQLVSERANQTPYLLTIGERAQAVVDAYQHRQKTTQETLFALEEIINDITQSERERVKMNLSPTACAVFHLMDRDGLPEAEALAREMEASFEKYPHWRISDHQQMDVRREIWKPLILARSKEKEGTRLTREEIDELNGLVDQIMRVAERAEA